MNPDLGTAKSPVTINVSYDLFQCEVHGVFAAHNVELGLTGYGETAECAFESLREVIDAYIRTSRQYGCLEYNLLRSGVDWSASESVDINGMSIVPIPWTRIIEQNESQAMVVG